MRIKNIYFLLCLPFLNSVISCAPDQREGVDFDQFGKYWFQGNAEISSFDLVQFRYGEAREGEAVLIFVSEGFSDKKQVKLDDPSTAGKDAVTVLKLNKTKDFVTGIYPYHMMLSVFTPVYEQSSALKLAASSQEWCGQTFTQINKSGNQYEGQLFSYFEEEGDQDFTLNALPEDDLWNLIRINPNQIPTGTVDLIPGLLNQRLTHRPYAIEEATISLADSGQNFQELRVEYTHGKRILSIRFYNYFPYEIASWEETRIYDDGTKETTTAQRKGMLQVDYWTKNKLKDESLRKELNLRQ